MCKKQLQLSGVSDVQYLGLEMKYDGTAHTRQKVMRHPNHFVPYPINIIIKIKVYFLNYCL